MPKAARPRAFTIPDPSLEVTLELELNRDIIAGIIDKAHEFNEQEDVTPLEDESEPDIGDGDFSELMTTRYGSDPLYQQLKGVIEDLDPDQQMSLVALMWVGRGDYTIEEWDDALELAEENWTEHTADYLIGTPLLADYLTEALEQIEESEED